MKKLLILIAVITYASTCFGFTYEQVKYTEYSDQVSDTYTVRGPSSSWYATSLSYTIDVYVVSGTTPRTTSTSTSWGRINIYDVKNNLLKTDYVEISAVNNGNSRYYSNTYYPSACNTPSINYAQLILYAEHKGDNTTGGQVWAKISAYNWISFL
jgi:hypothetical protein